MRIHYLAKRGDIEGVLQELAKGVPVDEPSEFDDATPLVWAIRSLHAGIDMLDALVKRGADVNRTTAEHHSAPLMAAAHAGNMSKVKFLLAAGADAAYVSSMNYTALIGGLPRDLEMIRVLIDAGTPLDAESPYGESALSVASRIGDFDAVKLLLDAGADPKYLEWTDFMRTVVLGSVADVEEALKGNPDLAAVDRWERTPWLLVVCAGDVAKAELLMNAGSDIKAAGRCGKTPLICAVEQGHAPMLRWLLSLGLDIDMTNQFGDTALMDAAQAGSVECVRALIEGGANISKVSNVSSQAINNATNIEIVGLLKEAGADIDYIDGTGAWLLHTATRFGDIEFVKGLLALGASAQTESIGRTALHDAAREDELEIMQILLDAGADPNTQDVDGGPPLLFARTIEAAELLLERGADAKLLYQAEFWPVWYDSEQDIMKLVKEAGWEARHRR